MTSLVRLVGGLPSIERLWVEAFSHELHRLLAEKVDSLVRAKECVALGFDLFQGFFYGRPTLVGA